ncbi:MAG TPA: transglutaminase-like domain-containing protein [Rhizomicrobium sp.]|jgi:regulator of sirC expression with transglutaminase-like and TPR domain
MSEQVQDPAIYLKTLGEAGEGPHDIAQAALILSLLDHPQTALAPYRAHLDEIAHHAAEEARLATSAETMARALSALMVGRYGYDGDRLTYDEPQNADLMAVIDRRRGLPVALGILYIHAARAAGCAAEGLNSPGHFLMRLSLRGGEALLDPFNGGVTLDREKLSTPPRMGGLGVADPADSVSDTEVLLRLQNNLKQRASQSGDHGRALDLAKRMVLIGPRRTELWLELARLQEGAGSLGAAKKAYEAALVLSKPGDASLNEAALALHALKRRLN